MGNPEDYKENPSNKLFEQETIIIIMIIISQLIVIPKHFDLMIKIMETQIVVRIM